MKIGVVTFWHGNSNYGQILQCWALQEFLHRHGHESFVIRFIPENYQSTAKRIIKKIVPVNAIKDIKCCFFNHKAWKSGRTLRRNDRMRGFPEFRESHITFSQRKYKSIDQLMSSPPIADCYITGSDQVWAQMVSNPNNHAFFLNFGSKDITRISYAPSFVVNEYPRNLRPTLKDLLSRFDFISVREYSGQEICRSVGVEAVKVLDPTFLLDSADYEAIAQKRTSRKQLFIYSLNIKSADEIRWIELKSLAKSKGFSVTVTPANGYFIGKELFGDDVQYQYSTPSEWIGNIQDSELVVTTSFHGVALSVILHRPFVYIPLNGQFANGNSRVLDLLRDVGLENRVLTDEREYEEIFDAPIDWIQTDQFLKPQIEASIKFLLNALDK